MPPSKTASRSISTTPEARDRPRTCDRRSLHFPRPTMNDSATHRLPLTTRFRRSILDLRYVFGALLMGMTALGLLASPASAQPEELPLGSSLPSPSTTLQDVDGTSVSVSDLLGSTATVFVFWSNQCPWVDKYEDRVKDIVGAYQGQGVRFVLVNANDASAFPGESLDASRKKAESTNYGATYVRDPQATFARSLGASRTPHVFVFDGSQTLVYAGTIDDSPGDAGNVSKAYLRDALDAVTSGSDVPVADTKAFGCTIKFPN